MFCTVVKDHKALPIFSILNTACMGRYSIVIIYRSVHIFSWPGLSLCESGIVAAVNDCLVPANQRIYLEKVVSMVF